MGAMDQKGGLDRVMALIGQGKAAEATALIQQRLGTGPLATGAETGAMPPPHLPHLPSLTGLPGGAVPLPGGALPRTLRQPGPTANTPDAMPRLRHDGPHGGRDYLLYAPEKPAARRGLVVMLHGCTQSAADFARGTAMNEAAGARGFHVIYPEQTGDANAMRCWNWFDPASHGPNSGEAALLAALIEDAGRQAGLDDADVFVAGLSAGGAMAALLAEAFPARITAVGIHSGLPAGAASSMPQAFQTMKSGAAARPRHNGVPVIVFHGDADQTVVPANGEAAAAHVGNRARYRGHAAGGLDWQMVKGEGGEYWRIAGMGHAWSGGSGNASHTDPRGPDASAEMMRFFAERRGG